MMDGVLLADLMTPVLILVRAALAVGGALVGWIVTGPALRVLYRLAFQRPVPGWLVPIGKLAGAVTVGLLVFFYLPLGGGAGWGWGPGWGMGKEDAKGAGDSTSKGTSEMEGTESKDTKVVPATPEKLEIELLGGSRITSEGRFYLVNRQPPAMTYSEVQAYMKEHATRLKVVHLVFTGDGIWLGHPAANRLRDLLDQYKIPMTNTQEK